jgi:uncharacterized RDD family membrane protein YckC
VAERARVVEVVTPEGVALPFEVAAAGDRVAAFLIDLAVIVAATLAVWLTAAALALAQAAAVGLSAALLASFFLRNGYFIASEIHWSGSTLGKRRLGLRVISRDGGPLTAEAVFARNLTRDLELFLPLTALAAPQLLAGGAPLWARWSAVAWLVVFAVVPLVNRERLRCGDLVAGTLVVRAPRAVLLPDLAGAEAATAATGTGAGSLLATPAAAEAFRFTRQQLDVYGIAELQVLEDLLRRYEQGSLDFDVLREVTIKINNKIGWPEGLAEVQVLPFLQAFYRAQRHRLEQKMLFGHRQERKRDVPPQVPGPPAG